MNPFDIYLVAPAPALAPPSNYALSMRSLLGKRRIASELPDTSLHKRLATELMQLSPSLGSTVDWFVDSRAALQLRHWANMNALGSFQAATASHGLSSTTGALLGDATALQGCAMLFPNHASEVSMLLQTRREVLTLYPSMPAALLNLFPDFTSATTEFATRAHRIGVSTHVLAGLNPSLAEQLPRAVPKVKSSPEPLQEEVTLVKIWCLPLASEEDPNWLSEFHTFVRAELAEVFFATPEDVAVRSNIGQKVFVNQVGIRCRCCATLTPDVRAPRHTSFPSSIGQIYQSFVMMLREHFGRCPAMPEDLKERFTYLRQRKTAQGAKNSKEFWEHAARALGMQDSLKDPRGIIMTERTRAEARQLHPFSSTPKDHETPVMAIWDDEKAAPRADYTFTLLQQVRLVYLQSNECHGNRKTRQEGLAGLACKYCTQAGRMGQSRVFPIKKRALPSRLEDLYQHLMRCTLCPFETKESLRIQRASKDELSKQKELYDLIWHRLKTQEELSRRSFRTARKPFATIRA
jgi:hypothetical protein